MKCRLDEAQAGIKIVRRNINNLRYADDTTLLAGSEELKSLLMKVKDESEKVGLKLKIKKKKTKNIYFCFTDYAKALTVWISTNDWKFLKRQEYQTTLPISEKPI